MDAPSVLQGITTRNEEAGVMSNTDSNARKLVPMPKPKAAPKRRARVCGEASLFLRGKMFWMELHRKGERFREFLETTDRETALIKLDNEVKAIRSGELPKTFEPITVQTMKAVSPDISPPAKKKAQAISPRTERTASCR